ncbi:MAG TPA: HD family hydrolase [Rhizomicrobium sp.]|nr:HD family hydrolase [Rhizomicrobium sp.]
MRIPLPTKPSTAPFRHGPADSRFPKQSPRRPSQAGPASGKRAAVDPGSRMTKDKPRAWQRMLSGRRLDLLDPSPLDVEIGDIAHGLARVARWNGQTKGEHAFSVAQHCVLVERITTELKPGLTKETRLMALLHDAPEYVIGDLISPFKVVIGINYKALELKLQSAIHLRFGLPSALPAVLAKLFKKADLIAAFFEATQLAGFELEVARKLFVVPPGQVRTPKLVPLSTAEAQAQFLEQFRKLAA